MRASEIREPGDAAYGQTMRAAEFMVSPSDEDLRSQATRYGGNGTWAFYAASLEKMLTQLVEATESRLGSSIAAAYIVPPFNPPLVPNPVRWHDLLRHVSASLGRQVPPSGVEATDLAITGLGDPCTPAYSNRKNPLILVSNLFCSFGPKQPSSRKLQVIHHPRKNSFEEQKVKFTNYLDDRLQPGSSHGAFNTCGLSSSRVFFQKLRPI